MRKSVCLLSGVLLLLSFTFLCVTQEANANAWAKYIPKYDPPIVITENMVVTKSMRFIEGDDIENNPFTRWAKDELGIVWKAKFITPDWDTAGQKINLAMASGDLPDVIFAPGPIIAKLVDYGVAIPLDDLIEKYGSPLTKYVLREHDKSVDTGFYNVFRKNNKTYAITKLGGGSIRNWAWIREDLLSELGKQMPQTIQQLEDVLGAYHKKYPDGVGFTLDKNLGGLDIIMQAFHAYPRNWIEKDGKLVYGSIQPEVKEGLKALRDWYKKGWLDREFIAKDGNKVIEDIVSGKTLICYGPSWYTSYPFPDLWKQNPKAAMAPIPPLKGPDGKQRPMLGFAPGSASEWATVITKKCKHPEAVIYQLNATLDSLLRNDKELRKLMKEKFGYEFKYPVTPFQVPLNLEKVQQGEFPEYNYKDQGPWDFFNHHLPTRDLGGVVVPYALPSEQFYKDVNLCSTLRELKIDLAKNSKEIPESVLNKLRERLSYGDFNRYVMMSSVPQQLVSFAKEKDLYLKVKDIYEYTKFVGAPTKTMQDKQAYLDKIELETFAKIIMGDLPVDAFDKFVKDWEKDGGDQITKEVNEWYKGIKQ